MYKTYVLGPKDCIKDIQMINIQMIISIQMTNGHPNSVWTCIQTYLDKQIGHPNHIQGQPNDGEEVWIKTHEETTKTEPSKNSIDRFGGGHLVHRTNR